MKLDVNYDLASCDLQVCRLHVAYNFRDLYVTVSPIPT